MRAKEKTQTNKNDKEKGTRITKYTCQKKIDEGHSIERVWHSASREPSDTLPFDLSIFFIDIATMNLIYTINRWYSLFCFDVSRVSVSTAGVQYFSMDYVKDICLAQQSSLSLISNS